MDGILVCKPCKHCGQSMHVLAKPWPKRVCDACALKRKQEASRHQKERRIEWSKNTPEGRAWRKALNAHVRAQRILNPIVRERDKAINKRCAAKRYARQPEEERRKRNEASRKNRAKLVSELRRLLGGRCANCGETDGLQRDHINNDGAATSPRDVFGRRRDVHVRIKIAEVLANPHKFQALCPTCNFVKHFEPEVFKARRGRHFPL